MAVNVIVFVYASVQFIQLAITVFLGMSFIPSIMISTWMTFGFDQVGLLTIDFPQFSGRFGVDFLLMNTLCNCSILKVFYESSGHYLVMYSFQMH